MKLIYVNEGERELMNEKIAVKSGYYFLLFQL